MRLWGASDRPILSSGWQNRNDYAAPGSGHKRIGATHVNSKMHWYKRCTFEPAQVLVQTNGGKGKLSR
jgi:hypothetical protein